LQIVWCMSMHWKVGYIEFGQTSNNFSKGTIHEMGPRFCGTQTSMKAYVKQIQIGGHKICNQMGGGQSIKDKHCNNNSKIYIWMHFYHVWMSINYSHKSRGAFYKWCYKSFDKSFFTKTCQFHYLLLIREWSSKVH
jgi:hypothetical protein